MTIEVVKLTGTTSAGGAATITATHSVLGKLYAVEWIAGDLADNNTAVLSVTNTPSGVDQAIHTLVAGEGDDDAWWFPRASLHDLSAVTLTFTGDADEIPVQPIIDGTLELVIAAGGDAKTGGCIVYLDNGR